MDGNGAARQGRHKDRNRYSGQEVRQAMKEFRSFINGKWIDSTSGKTSQNINPANTDDVIGTIQLASRDEARQAVEAAYDAFREWKRTPAPARGRIVAKAARLMEDRKEELAQAITREEGKTIAEARGETQRAINVVEFCAGESRRRPGSLDRWPGSRCSAGTPTRSR